MTQFVPETAEQLKDAVAWAVAEEFPVAVKGSGTKSGLGRPVTAEHEIDLSKLSGITLYEPEELVLRAGAGTPMAEITAALEAQNQQLAFEPPDLGYLLKGESAPGTIGGAVAANLSGPRRIKAGAARDHFLGFEGVSGRGESFKSGGRVMKNVTGYDLCKLMAGSWGTLAVMSEVTVKVLPKAEKERTVLLYTDDPVVAVRALTDALNSPYEVSGAAWMPKAQAASTGIDHVMAEGTGAAAIRVEGPGPSVEYRCARLREMAGPLGKTEELHSHRGKAFWKCVGDVMPFAAAGDNRVVWKLSVAPADGPAVYTQLLALKGAEAFMDWGGGLIWLAVDMPNLGGAELVRDIVAKAGGHATLMRGDTGLRAKADVFHPLAPGLEAITRKIKNGFDPHGVLNPGRMYDGI